MEHLLKPRARYLNHSAAGWGKKRQGWDAGHWPYWALDLAWRTMFSLSWMAYLQSFLRPKSWWHQNPGWSIWGVMKEEVCCHDLPMWIWINISLLQKSTGNKAPCRVALTYTQKASSGLFSVFAFLGLEPFFFPCFCIQSFLSMTRGVYVEQGHLPCEGDLFRSIFVSLPQWGLTQPRGLGLRSGSAWTGSVTNGWIKAECVVLHCDRLRWRQLRSCSRQCHRDVIPAVLLHSTALLF